MTLWATLLQLSILHILMAMIPGPNTVVVSYVSARVSRRAGSAPVSPMNCAVKSSDADRKRP